MPTTSFYKAFLSSAPLWQGLRFGLTQFNFPKVSLSNYVVRSYPFHLRLGHQMEYIFRHLIQHSLDYEVKLHNLVIKENNLSIGEIDFILQHIQTKQLFHIELAYKFYLIDDRVSDPQQCLIGPNRRDHFITKIEKIKQKQIPLLYHNSTKKTLMNYGIDIANIQHQVCYKAQLFVPYTHKKLRLKEVNNSCIAGYWLRLVMLDDPVFYGARFYIPEKYEWVLQPSETATRNWVSYEEGLSRISPFIQEQRAPMVWILHTNITVEKCFVVWW